MPTDAPSKKGHRLVHAHGSGRRRCSFRAMAHRQRLGALKRMAADRPRRSTLTSGKEGLISIFFTPWPSQAVAAPAGLVLNEKRLAHRSRACAPRPCRRTCLRMLNPRSRRRSPGRSAASCRSASGPLPARAATCFRCRRCDLQPMGVKGSPDLRCASLQGLLQIGEQHIPRHRRSCPMPDTPVTAHQPVEGEFRASAFFRLCSAGAA